MPEKKEEEKGWLFCCWRKTLLCKWSFGRRSLFAVLAAPYHRDQTLSVGSHPSANIWDHKLRSKSESKHNTAVTTNNQAI